MERLPYIDTHEIEVPADLDAVWRALVRMWRGSPGEASHKGLSRVLRVDPPRAAGDWSPDPEPGVTVPGFSVAQVRPAELLSLRGCHRFSRYRLDFELATAGSDRTLVSARSWAEFPGIAGAIYRSLVIRSGAHRLAVRRMLRRVAAGA